MSIKEVLAKQLGDSVNAETLASLVTAAEAEAQSLIVAEVKGLKDNQAKNLEQISRLKGNQLPDGFDKDAFDKYKADKVEFDKKQAELEDKRLADEGQWEGLKSQLLEKNKLNIETIQNEKDSEIKGLRSALDKELIENSAIKAIEKEKGNSFFLLPHMKQQIQTTLVDGKYQAQVLDAEGNARMDDDGKNFTVAQLVAEMKSNEMFAPAFPSQNSGSGQAPNAGGTVNNGANPWKSDTKNITQQAKMMKENPTLAAQMKKAAGVA